MSKVSVSSCIAQLGGGQAWVSFKESLSKGLRPKKKKPLDFLKGASFVLLYKTTIANLSFKIRALREEG